MSKDYKYYTHRVNLSPALSVDIANIAANKGMKINEFLRHEIRKVVDATPEHFKKEFKK